MLKTLKHSVRTALRSTGWDIARHSPLARAVEVMAARGEDPTFVQIGANDGVIFDNLRQLVTHHKLGGICVEPVPDYFASLIQTYINQKRVLPVQAALHPTEKVTTIYRVDPDDDGEVYYPGLASFDRNNLVKHGVKDASILAIQVPCLTFSELVAQHLGGRAVDILVVDTEGFDAEVIGMIDFTIHRPAIIQFEKKHLPTPVFDGLRTKLRGLGYRVEWANDDCSAVRPDLLAPLSYMRAML